MQRGRPKTANPRKEVVATHLNTYELSLLNAAAGETPRAAFLRRLLLLAAEPLSDPTLTEHLVVRLSPADLAHVQTAKGFDQCATDYVLGLIRADARARQPLQSAPEATSTPAPPWAPTT